jgi:hypothetical protein
MAQVGLLVIIAAAVYFGALALLKVYVRLTARRAPLKSPPRS